MGGETLSSVESLLQELARKSQTRVPGGWRSKVGDCVRYFNEDASHYRERVDELLTLYRADDDARIIGVQIKGMSRLPKHDVLAILVQSGELEVVTLLMLTFAQRPERKATENRAQQYADAIIALGRPVAARGDLQTA